VPHPEQQLTSMEIRRQLIDRASESPGSAAIVMRCATYFSDLSSENRIVAGLARKGLETVTKEWIVGDVDSFGRMFDMKFSAWIFGLACSQMVQRASAALESERTENLNNG
jgi:hypothetical protein